MLADGLFTRFPKPNFGFARVLATVLITDIVDSTKRAAEQDDRGWRTLLDQHDQTVRQQFARFRGHEVKNLGDGFMATFDGPARAVRCAAAICDSVRPLGIAVRSGLHSGEIELKRDDGQEWKEFLKTNYVFMFGIPLAVTAAFGLVVFFGVTSPDPIELNIWGLVLKGPAGPLLMWVVVFLSLVLAIKVLWPR